MNIVQFNKDIADFVKNNDLTDNALALQKEHAIANSEEWQRILDGFAEKGRLLRIGIIGRVKAGKSSMLNALLFNGNDILPKAATPMTAALTIMEYSENIRAEVEFFSQEDIDEIKENHDAYQRQLDALIISKQNEALERALQRKKNNRKKTAMSDSKLTETEKQLTPAEENQAEEHQTKEKAKSAAEREMRNAPTFAAYDQYQRIKESGKTLSDLQKYSTIEANSIEELMNGALNDFVGSSGAFMPFTKSVTLYIPEQGLKGLQIIDTPGINDPVTSRGERTENLLAECDAVLIVSPSGQFLSNEDTNLMYRITTKEGTQEAYIIASQVDNQLYGSESLGFNHPSEVLQKISTTLTKQARMVLAKLVEEEPQIQPVADKLKQNDVICSSSVAFALLQRFDEQDAWDSNMQTAWNNLTKKFPETFNHPELAKSALKQLANTEKLHQVINEVSANKEQILEERLVNFKKQKLTALQDYLKGLQSYTEGRIHEIKNSDINELNTQKERLLEQKESIQLNVDETYDDLIYDIKINLKKQLKDVLKNTMNQYHSSEQLAHGTTTKEEVYVERKLLFFKKRKTRTYEVSTVQATSVLRAINDARTTLEDTLQSSSITYTNNWKDKLREQIFSDLREAMGDDEIDKKLVRRTIRNIFARIPEPNFELTDDLPKSIKKRGKLEGNKAENFIEDAQEYVINLESTISSEIDDYIADLVSELKQFNLASKFVDELQANLEKLVNDINNRQSSLYRYESIQKGLQQLETKMAM